MREILFRGKRIDNSGWVYGLVTAIGEKYSTIHVVYPKYEMDYRVYTKTVGQYTELKDKNGEKIFEGDFVTFHTEYEMPDDDVWYEKEPYLVKWDNEIAGFEPFYLNGRWRCNIVNLKIIGNKWDNPELLEE